MAEDDAITQPLPVLYPVNLSSGVTRGLDGTMWPVIEIEVALTKYTFGLPTEACENLAKLSPAFFTEAAAIARRAQLGLIVPQNGNMPVDIKKLKEPGQ